MWTRLIKCSCCADATNARTYQPLSTWNKQGTTLPKKICFVQEGFYGITKMLYFNYVLSKTSKLTVRCRFYLLWHILLLLFLNPNIHNREKRGFKETWPSHWLNYFKRGRVCVCVRVCSMLSENRTLTIQIDLLDGLAWLRGLTGAVHVDWIHSELVLLPILQIKNRVTGGKQLDACVDPLPRSSAC